MPRFEPLHIYQLQRHQGAQSQFRLCLGIIETNLEADAILDLVTEFYPRARCEPAQDDDRAAVKRKVMAAQPPKRSAQSPRFRQPDPQPPAPFHWDIDELLPELAANSLEQTRARPLNQPGPPTGADPVPKMLPQPREAVELEYKEAPDGLAAASVAATPAPGVEEIDSDPNAVTDQVETLQFTFGDPPVEEPPAETSNSEEALDADAAATQETFEGPATQPPRIESEASEAAKVGTTGRSGDRRRIRCNRPERLAECSHDHHAV